MIKSTLTDRDRPDNIAGTGMKITMNGKQPSRRLQNIAASLFASGILGHDFDLPIKQSTRQSNTTNGICQDQEKLDQTNSTQNNI
jgi:hypothetical protein